MVFRSFPKLHQNRPVPHQISPPNSHFIKKTKQKKQSGASFPGFYLPFLTPRLARLSLLTPWTTTSCLTLTRASQPKTCLFHSAAWRVSPIQAAKLPSPVRWRRVPPGHPTLPFQSSPVLTASLDLPSDAGESLPARQPCLFHPTAGETYPSRLRASISSQVTASASQPPNFTFPSSPVRQRVLISRRMSTESLPATQLTFPSSPVRHSESWAPVGRRREHSRPDKPYLFKPQWVGLPVEHRRQSQSPT